MKPFISESENIAELTMRSIILAIILTVILAVSNAYLALKLGILTSASIPAAIISMGILRFFKNPTILENNAVQTAASAGEAVAGGIVYTIPALIIIEYWHHFDYFTNFLIAFSGGVLGVLFSIPLRRLLVHDKSLKFPEGRAIAEVLKSSSDTRAMRDIVCGGVIGGILELLQNGFKIIASNWNYWFSVNGSIFGLGAGFSATMVGAGFLVGFDMACSIFGGAIISWLISLPIVSQFYPEYLLQQSVAEAAVSLWTNELRYLGIGAMLFAGIWTFLKLSKPLINNIYMSWSAFTTKRHANKLTIRTEKDMPMPLILLGIALISILLFVFFQAIFPLNIMGLTGNVAHSIIIGAVFYILIVGFLFSVMTAYFSGMVGVTASPGSSVVIAGILFASWILLGFLHKIIPWPLEKSQLIAAEAVIIIISSIVTGIAAIANDNTQDLKVGQLVGATPWKQQVMLLIGVLISALIIPPVMQVLFEVYGIAGVMPHAGMDLSQSLPAPTAALLAAITEAVFRDSLPWIMMFVGAGIIAIIIVVNRLIKLQRFIQISILGVAMGMYLPITSSCPLFLGGMIAFFVKRRLYKHSKDDSYVNPRKQIGTRIACGLVAGSAIISVVLAIPFSMLHSPDALSLVNANWNIYGLILAIASMILLAVWMRKRICE